MSGLPVLSIDGVRIARGWDRTVLGGLVQLGRVSIPWGRSSIFEDVTGHLATVELLDTAQPSQAVDRDLVGLPARIDRVDGSMSTPLLVGMVAEQVVDAVEVSDPLTGMTRELRRYTLTLADTASTLATMRERGQGQGLPIYGTGGVWVKTHPGAWKIGGWDQQFPADRARDIKAVAGPWAPNLVTPSSSFPRALHELTRDGAANPLPAGVPADALESLWTLTSRLYAHSVGLGWPRVIPGARIEQAQPLHAAPIRLVRDVTGWLRLAQTNTIVPASQLALVDPKAQPSLSAAQRIGSVSVAIDAGDWRYESELQTNGAVTREEKLTNSDESTTIVVEVANARGSTQQKSIDAGAAATIVRQGPAGTYAWKGSAPNEGWNAGIALAVDAAMRAGYLNQWLQLPPLLHRPRLGTNPLLLRTWDWGPIYLAGSKWLGTPGAPRVVHIIGGTLEWSAERGWEHELHLAPTLDTMPRDLTLADLFGTANDRLDRFDESVTLADLAAVSESQL